MYKLVVLSIVAAGALLAACGTGGGTGGPTTVPITMSEFKIDSPQTTFKVGVPYRFVVTNKGTVNHDFSITPPTMAHSGMGTSLEEAHEDALAVIKAEDLPPGATKTVDVTFTKPYAANEMEFACHTPGHYESRMRTAITVTQ